MISHHMLDKIAFVMRDIPMKGVNVAFVPPTPSPIKTMLTASPATPV